MKRPLYLLFLFFVITSLVLSGCALEHHGRFYISSPHINDTFLPTDHITITLHRYSSVDPYHYFRYQIRDNGNILISNEARGELNDIQYILNGDSNGVHLIDARAQAFDTTNSHSDWYPATSVCIYVGGNPPANFTCNQYAWPQNLEFVTTTPTSSILTIVTEAPPVTPIIIIRPDNPNNNNGGKPGGSGATGCGAYGDKSSCDAAGCSWNGSSCTVSP